MAMVLGHQTKRKIKKQYHKYTLKFGLVNLKIVTKLNEKSGDFYKIVTIIYN